MAYAPSMAPVEEKALQHCSGGSRDTNSVRSQRFDTDQTQTKDHVEEATWHQTHGARWLGLRHTCLHTCSVQGSEAQRCLPAKTGAETGRGEREPTKQSSNCCSNSDSPATATLALVLHACRCNTDKQWTTRSAPNPGSVDTNTPCKYVGKHTAPAAPLVPHPWAASHHMPCDCRFTSISVTSSWPLVGGGHQPLRQQPEVVGGRPHLSQHPAASSRGQLGTEWRL